jgi:glycosyltransferase involved in cell wall biosynthesis
MSDRDESTRTRRFSILQLGSHLWPECGGIYKNANNFRAALASSGHLSEIVSFDQIDGTDDGSITRFPVSRLPGLKYMDFAPAVFSARMKKRVEKSDCVVMHGVYSLANILLIRHAREFGVPVIIAPEGGLDPWVFSYRSWRKKIWFRLFRDELINASALIFATDQEKRKAKPLVDSQTSVVINWPVNHQATYDKRHAELKLRTRFQIPHDAKVLLYCGRIHPMKRPLETARAFLAAQPSKWVLLFVGPFSSEISKSDLTAACGASSGKCVIAGPQFGQGLTDCYQGASAFVSLSHRENFGYTVAEAASYGLPVLVSHGVDLSPDVMRHGAGVVCAESSPEAFGHAISNFCNLPDETLREMGDRGRQWVLEDLSPIKFAAKLEAVINRVTNGTPGAAVMSRETT